MAAPLSAAMPYRDNNTNEIKYATTPNNPIAPLTSPYDSDNEPLIAPAPIVTELDPDSMQRFTATGRPMPGFKASGLQSLGGDMYSLPQLLPKRYTDDSIIPAIVVDVIPSPKVTSPGAETDGKKRRGSLFGKLKGKREEKEGKKLTKVVYMPRREYLKYFARGLKGEYTGSEPQRQWSEEELEREFGKYKPEPVKRARNGI